MKKQYMRTVPNVMQSKVNYFFIFSPLSFCWGYINTGDFICQCIDYGIAFSAKFYAVCGTAEISLKNQRGKSAKKYLLKKKFL